MIYKIFAFLFLIFALTFTNFAQNTPNIFTTDIDNFWTAYDKIVTTKDNNEQLEFLNKDFIEKASIGQQAMFKARRYQPQEYIDSINKRPEYWNSIRQNTLRARDYANEIATGIEKLRAIYPNLKPANIYFTVGVFRSGGTTSGNNILIGSEIVFGREDLMKDLAFTNVHEYIHTQQNNAEEENLFERSVREGIAEFVSVIALNQASITPAMSLGKTFEPRLKTVFASQMFNPEYGFWLYSDAKNEFNTRDLGYYVGYAIAEKFYKKAKDKKLAIKEMIELDFNKPEMIAKYVDSTGYFPKSIAKLLKDYEKNRPQIVKIAEFKNGNKKVNPNIKTLTITFSKPMDKDRRNFNFGPLGKDNAMLIKDFLGYSEDGKTLSLSLQPLVPNKRYQLQIGQGFRDINGIHIKPYLIDITTTNK